MKRAVRWPFYGGFLRLTFYAAVLFALGLAVELVAVGLAEALFVRHAFAKGGREGPDEGLARARHRGQGETTHRCKGGNTRHHINTWK